MIKVYGKLKQCCYDLFGEEDGNVVYNFYKYFFSTKFKYQGYTNNITDENKIKNIEYILSKNTKENFLACINKFTTEETQGTVKTHNMNYFSKAAESYKENNKSINKFKNNTIDEIKTENAKIVSPKKNKKIRTDYDDDFYNYNYICSCKSELSPWDITCPKCHGEIDWKSLN
jgi:hypothetical protein